MEVAGIWELGWSAPKTEIELWRMAMRSFGLSRLNATPVTGIRDRLVCEYHSMEELLADRSHLTPVFVDEGGTTELSEFDHPDSALYVFGKAAYSPFSARAKQGMSVRIDCPKMGMLWPHQALAVVMYDRERKR